jgi:hypothetical protein
MFVVNLEKAAAVLDGMKSERRLYSAVIVCWIGNHIMFMLSKLATLMLVTKKPLYVLYVFKTVLLALLQ